MSEAKPAKPVPAVEPFGVHTPAQAARRKKERDARRKSIREQNARSKT